ARDAVVEDAIAHRPGARRDTAHGGQGGAQVLGIGDDVADSRAGGMHAVRGGSYGRPGKGILRNRRIPAAEVNARDDDLAVGVLRLAQRVARRIAEAIAAEHRRIVVDTAVNRGELDAGPRVLPPAYFRLAPQVGRVDQIQAGVKV